MSNMGYLKGLATEGMRFDNFTCANSICSPSRDTNIAMDRLKERDPDKPFLLSLQFKAPRHDYGHAERYGGLLAGVEIPEPPTLYDKRLILGGGGAIHRAGTGPRMPPTQWLPHQQRQDYRCL